MSKESLATLKYAEPLTPKLTQAAYKIEVVYHTPFGRYVEVIKDRYSRATPENVEEPK